MVIAFCVFSCVFVIFVLRGFRAYGGSTILSPIGLFAVFFSFVYFVLPGLQELLKINTLDHDFYGIDSLATVGTIAMPLFYFCLLYTSFFDQIRRDAPLRNLAMKELTQRGFDLGLEPENKGETNAGVVPRVNKGGERVPERMPAPPKPYENRNSPQVERRPSPYLDLPSVRDLYSQFPSSAAKLRRFGSEVFALGSGNADRLPTDLPAGPDYVLGPGDNLIVNLWGGQASRLSRTIDRQGQISLPEAGTIPIGGLNITHAEAAIAEALGTQFKNEHVEISLGRVRTVRVYVVGDVQRPGAYDVSSLSTPLNALFAAGGPTDRGSLRVMRQYRGAQLIREVDLYDFLLHGVRSEIDRLEPGDTLLVPPVGPQVSIAGMVRRPAVYELKSEQGLDQVLDLAGGTLASANLKQITEMCIRDRSRTWSSPCSDFNS